MTQDTIYALSSGAPPSAIAVIRISGPNAGEALRLLAGSLPEPRRAGVAKLKHPRTGELLDEALVLFFPAPRSATGENIAELHLHGGRSVVRAVAAALGEVAGLRPAEPGEFTRRAFENGRIDLAEAEGLADLLLAETESQRRAALALAGGALSRMIADWQHRLLGLSAQLEAVLDFSDEDDVGDQIWSAPPPALLTMIEEMQASLARPPAERLREGVRIAIGGPPNAGKSSLLNHLIGREAAITSPSAGTTRDLVEAPTAISGTPFLFTDTAGLRESEDEVEAVGVARAREALHAADIILWLGDPNDSPVPERTIYLASKADIPNVVPPAKVDVSVSSVTGEGMAKLIQLLLTRSNALLPQEGEVATNARHRAVIASCLELLGEVAESHDPLVSAELLRRARILLDQVTGRAGVEEMLDGLFGRFCIGK